MSIIKDVNVFSIGKELYESILILAKLELILYLILHFSLIRYLILSQIALYLPGANNIKYLIPS